MARVLIATRAGGANRRDAESRALTALARLLAEEGWIIEVRDRGEEAPGDRVASSASGAVRVAYVDDPVGAEASALAGFDAVLCPSRIAADWIREVAGIEAIALPTLVDGEAVRAEGREPRFLTFVDPTAEGGVFAFARIADELGKRRPDIPILVVEGTGTEATVAACGLDLRRHGNVFFMAPPIDPRRYYRVTRALLLPALAWDSRGTLAAEAMVNGIPVIASDRGALPEVLGESGVVRPLTDRLTTATRWLPTADEVGPWVESILRLWDDEGHFDERCGKALDEARRFTPDVLRRQYVEFFESIAAPPTGTAARGPSVGITAPGRARSIVLVPHLSGIEWECEQSLRRLEEAGVRVVRSEGSSQIDVARSQMASDALHEGFESIQFIDADIGFDPADALKLLARPEAVLSGVYAKKGRRELASRFAEGLGAIRFGPGAGPYPLQYAATGFLRIRASVLRAMIAALDLPLCNTRWSRGFWPFFQPFWVSDGDGGFHYLGEDWSFSHRLAQIGVVPLADTSIRLWHYGRYGYGWEDAGEDRPRYASYGYHTTEPAKEGNPGDPPW